MVALKWGQICERKDLSCWNLYLKLPSRNQLEETIIMPKEIKMAPSDKPVAIVSNPNKKIFL